MRIEIIGRNYTVSDRLRTLIEKKSEKLARYFDSRRPDTVIKYVCSEDNKGKFTFEGTIFVGDRILRAEETSVNIYDNLDVVIPKIERQIRKHRTRLEKQFKANGADITLENGDAPEEKQQELKAVRKKEFELKPMSLEDAIAELEMLDHDFYIFLNDENGKVNVVYKRVKGNVGLIECSY